MAIDQPHSLLSPSKAERWMTCPGSVALSIGAPDEPSVYADEGTAAHELAASALTSKDGVDCDSYLGIVIKVRNEDKTIRNEFEVDDEMASRVQIYVDEIRRRSQGCELLVEERVDYSDAVGIANQSGTSDAIILDHMTNTIEVHDLKYGRGNAVHAAWELAEDEKPLFEVERDGVRYGVNWQLLLYALGALTQFDLVSDWERVIIGIHMPRFGEDGFIDTFELTIDELRRFAMLVRARAAEAGQFIEWDELTGEFVVNQAAVASVPFEQEYLSPSEYACKWCPASATCPAILNAVRDGITESIDTTLDFDDLTVEAVEAGALNAPREKLPRPSTLELIEIFLNAARSRIVLELRSGNAVPGWKLVSGKRGPRKWIKDKLDEVEKTLKGMRLKKEEMYDEKLKSPTQIVDKVLKDSPKRQSKVQEFIEQSPPGLHAAPEDDPREAVAGKSESFDDLTTGEPADDLL